ncbi:unnamed protein product [Adineta steineri]|uniref:Uncharacterized protein n=1 Tax=Adineta steineri TaxID=433720 RepID=A0A818VY08_9BILA|nr:unnamed protein product [Adineta steineri]CAF3717674.1 unnamed protein product [Adineta steineri]
MKTTTDTSEMDHEITIDYERETGVIFMEKFNDCKQDSTIIIGIIFENQDNLPIRKRKIDESEIINKQREDKDHDTTDDINNDPEREHPQQLTHIRDYVVEKTYSVNLAINELDYEVRNPDRKKDFDEEQDEYNKWFKMVNNAIVKTKVKSPSK